MKKEELILMALSPFGRPNIPGQRLDEVQAVWKKAFLTHGKETGNLLNINCSPCFGKVLAYHLEKALPNETA